MTRARMLAQISSFELEQWAALYRIEAEERQAEAEQQAGQDAPEVAFTPSMS